MGGKGAPNAPGSNPMSMDFLLDSKTFDPSAASVLSSGNSERPSSPFSLIPSTRSPDPLAQREGRSKEQPSPRGDFSAALKSMGGVAGAKRKAVHHHKPQQSERLSGQVEFIPNRDPSPSRDLAVAIDPVELKKEVTEMLKNRDEMRLALAATDVNDWEWCKKRLIGNASRGSPAYSPWWGIFMESVPLGKRLSVFPEVIGLRTPVVLALHIRASHPRDDIRNISRAAPAPKNKVEINAARKDPTGRTWLQVGMNVEVKWETEWWQAKIKKVKLERGGDRVEKVLVGYIGGTDDENEWIPFAGRRLRPPTEAFDDTSKGH
ncbi:hypothetical protein T484DRAFT_1854074 [Baffinella frigidus]|nr:hypothetical protein T484DRAFT_1854074 [Cryptophyta sp. CCMP2293]